MATIYDSNLQLDSDYTYATYAQPVATTTVTTNIAGDVTIITTINGNSGSGASGPAITFSGGTTGLDFDATGSAVTLTGTLVAANGGTGISSYSQGDLLFASASTTISKLTKDTNSTRYLSNTGSSNNPAWAQVNLANGVTGTLPIGSGGTNATTAATARTNLEVPRVHTATVAPAVGDDGASGFPRGTIWVDTVLNDGYLSVDDSTGAAIWKLIT